MLSPGDHIDIWVVEKALGSGGMGSVYRCHNRTANRILAAVKVLEEQVRRHPEAEARFIREAEILFQLDHPNIVKVRNVRTDTSPPYLEMEFVEGGSLEALMRRGAQSEQVAASLMEQMLAAVAYLHNKGVRHRDIKPANFVVKPDGRIKLVDFGLAMEAETTRITQSNMSFGTVSYAPPEWITPDAIDPTQWDIYAIGVVFWELLTGEVAFPVSGQGSARQQAMQVILAKQSHPALDPGARHSEPMRALIRALTEPSPKLRISNADLALRMLKEALVPVAPGQTLMPEVMHSDEREPPSVVITAPRPGVGDTWREDQTLETSEVGVAVLAAPVLSEPPAPRRRRAITGLLGGLVALGLFGALVLGLIAVAVVVLNQPRTPPSPSLAPTLSVAIDGLHASIPHEVRLDDKAVLPNQAGRWEFSDLSAGKHSLSWTVGATCTLSNCPGETCPAWCITESRSVQVSDYPPHQPLDLMLGASPTRAVTLIVSAPTGGPPPTVTVDQQPITLDQGAGSVSPLPLGPHRVTVSLGACADAPEDCAAASSCPPGCTRQAEELVLLPGQGAQIARYSVAPPTPVPDPTQPKPPTPATVKVPLVSPRVPLPDNTSLPAPSGTSRASKPITQAQFADWLASHAEYERSAAIASNKADKNYLASWIDGAPPQPSAPAVEVSWGIATSYCLSRGGLADIDAEPTSWAEGSSGAAMEWRRNGGKPALRESTGTLIEERSTLKSNVFTGFRCAR